MAGLLDDPRLGDGRTLSSYQPTLRERATDYVRGLLFSDDREGQQRAERVLDVVDATGLGLPMDFYDAGREAGMGNYGAAGVLGAMTALPLPAAVKKSASTKIRQTVKDPIRNANPGIYKNPKVIAQEAAARVAPEDPALKQLFGVSRDDLYEISKRKGNADPVIRTAANPKGSAAVDKIKTKANEQRLIDGLSEARNQPDLFKGMHGWYVMDPAYNRLVELVGTDEAKRLYTRFNTMVGMASPGSEVLTEINRGTAANMMADMGRFDEFARYGGMAADRRGADFPPELSNVIGHPYHSTSQAAPMRSFLEKGEVDMGSPKVPLYIQSSGVPDTGFQTSLPVPDAHFTRAVGLPDTRGSQDFNVSMKMPEYQSAGPWFRDRVAAPSGMESVPAQAVAWGLYSPQTGVTTEIGAPKLELLSQRIMAEARRRGIDPAALRDAVLTGKSHASVAGLLGGGAALGAMQDEDQ